jgi:FMN phosphatase YigB (HAD superfamily)
MSDKKVLGMSLFGIIKSKEPWHRAHEVGMRELAKRSGMSELVDLTQDDNYFRHFRAALSKIDEYKDLSEEDRVSLRRKQYFERVLDFIRGGDFVDEAFVLFMKELKRKYRLVLISTGVREFVDNVLKLAGAEGVFDDVVCLDPYEEDDKRTVFSRAVNKLGKIDMYVGSDSVKAICEEFGVSFIKCEGIDGLRRKLV